MRALLLLSLATVSCGGAAADRPLGAQLGLDRERTQAELRRWQYCRAEQDRAATELYPRCDRPGTEWGDSWVKVTFAQGRAVRIERWERYDDPDHAAARWNQLVADRSAATLPSAEARQTILGAEQLPNGTQTFAAFRTDDDTVVGVYLLTPLPPDRANVLEQIIELPAPNGMVAP